MRVIVVYMGTSRGEGGGGGGGSFFFQAEDGIRDRLVTGVQTCALPISVTPPLIVIMCAKSIVLMSPCALGILNI